MKKEKPQISYSWTTGQFLKDGRAITFNMARKLWLNLSADWTQGAYQQMAKLTLS